MQVPAQKQQYYADLKRGQANPDAVDGLAIRYYTDLVNQNKNGVTTAVKEKNARAAGGVDEWLGPISEGSLCLPKPQFCHIKNGVLSLVNQGINLQECVALRNYLVNAVTMASAA